MFMLVCSAGDTDIGLDIFRFVHTTYIGSVAKDLYMDLGLVMDICICTDMEWRGYICVYP